MRASTLLLVIALLGGTAFAGCLFPMTNRNPTPRFELSVDENRDRLTVTFAQPDADWARVGIRLRSSDGNGSVFVGGGDTDPDHIDEQPDSGSGVALEGRVALAPKPKPMKVGQFLAFCQTSVVGPISLHVVDDVAHELMGTFSLESVRKC